jgi:HK97 family phage prohead protease
MKKSDFSGYASKSNVRCTDGRTILPNAFAGQDGQQVPLVFQHDHTSTSKVLGHAVLENRADGLYCYGYFNSTPAGKEAKEIVRHGDMNSLSVYANHLQSDPQTGKIVQHGQIREVSLVFAPANPEAVIENAAIQHGDGYEELIDEAVIQFGDKLEHGIDLEEEVLAQSEKEDQEEDESANEEASVDDVMHSLTPIQAQVVYTLLNLAKAGKTEDLEHSDKDDKKSDADSADDKSDAESKSKGEDDKPSDESKSDDKEASEKKTDDDNESAKSDQKKQDDKSDSKEEDAKSKETDEKSKKQDSELKHSERGVDMGNTNNVFEKNGQAAEAEGEFLSHEDQKAFLAAAEKDPSGSFQRYAMQHAQDYGIKNIDVLFPDAKAVQNEPDLYKRDTAWVASVLGNTHHTPFSRIKSTYVDITEDDARAKGFTLDRDNNHRKLDEIVKAAKRITTPTTVYKKQKLDRDDQLDITDFDVVNWLMGEMRIMLDEEIARAILIGDGRKITDETHINTESIRPIIGDDDLYVVYSDGAAEEKPSELVDRIRKSKVQYRGSGTLVAYMAPSLHAEFAVLRDQIGHRMYETDQALAFELGVSSIQEVPLLEGFKDAAGKLVKAVIVDLRDYNTGTDRGGDITSFSDFDIDYNQNKYLLETRLSGALTKPKSAIVVTAAVAAAVGQG